MSSGTRTGMGVCFDYAQTFRNARKPQLFFDDAWGGLLYWNGISRGTNASTITFMSLEYRNRPIYNDDGTVRSRKGNSFVMQWHMFF